MARREGIERTVYLGGLGDEPRSKHLRSRQRTAELLAEHGPPLIYFRAGMVVGAGSESYRTLRYLVQRLPAMIAPAWLKTPTQPIAVHDVIEYLVDAPDVVHAGGAEVQIGGPDVLSYGDMLDRMAEALGIRPRHRVPVPAAHALAVIALDRVGHAGGRRGRAAPRRGTLHPHGRHRPGRDGRLRRRAHRDQRGPPARAGGGPRGGAGPPGRRPPASGGPLPRSGDRAGGEHQQGRAPGAGALGRRARARGDRESRPRLLANSSRGGRWELFRATEDEEGRVRLLLRGTPLEPAALRSSPLRVPRRAARRSPGRSQGAP